MITTNTAASLHHVPDGAVDRDTLPDFLMLFASLHDAMRRDAARLEAAVAGVDPSAVQPLRSWWHRFAAVITHHHHREDDVVWPALEARAPGFAADAAPLHEDHEALDRAMGAVRTTLAALEPGQDAEWARRDAFRAVIDFRSILVDHLAREEALAFPLLVATYTAEEYAELERQLRRGTSLRAAAFEVPWVLDGASPRVLALADEALPGPMRACLHLWWERSYRRIAAPVRGVA